jgi:hypothetical protein
MQTCTTPDGWIRARGYVLQQDQLAGLTLYGIFTWMVFLAGTANSIQVTELPKWFDSA